MVIVVEDAVEQTDTSDGCSHNYKSNGEFCGSGVWPMTLTFELDPGLKQIISDGLSA